MPLKYEGLGGGASNRHNTATCGRAGSSAELQDGACCKGSDLKPRPSFPHKQAGQRSKLRTKPWIWPPLPSPSCPLAMRGSQGATMVAAAPSPPPFLKRKAWMWVLPGKGRGLKAALALCSWAGWDFVGLDACWAPSCLGISWGLGQELWPGQAPGPPLLHVVFPPVELELRWDPGNIQNQVQTPANMSTWEPLWPQSIRFLDAFLGLVPWTHSKPHFRCQSSLSGSFP